MLGSKQPAFTIVELLVVIVVIGILAAITITSYTGISSRATVSSLQSDLTNILTQLKLDQVTNSMFPSSLAAANGGKGIPSTSGTSYTYTYSNTTNPQTFCITATKNNISYNITGDGNSQPGICPVLNLDAGNISSYPGTGTTWTDLSGNGNSGVLNGGVTYSASNGGVMSFDGVDDYVATPLLTTEQFGSIEKTISVWVKPSTVGNFMIYSTGQGGDGNNRIYAWSSGNLWAVNIGDNSNSSNVAAVANQWVNIVVSIKNTTAYIYINGQLIQTKTFVGFTTQNSLILGRHGLSSSYGFYGLISNVGIYNISLSASDILQNFNTYRGRYGI